MSQSFKEEDHPRDSDGQFTSKDGGDFSIGNDDVKTGDGKYTSKQHGFNFDSYEDYIKRRDASRAKLGFKPLGQPETKPETPKSPNYVSVGSGYQKWLDSQKKPDDVPPPEVRPQGQNYRIEARKAVLMARIKSENSFLDKMEGKIDPTRMKNLRNNVKELQDKLDNIGTTEFEKSLPHIPMGKNTHTKSMAGFVINKTNVKIDPVVKTGVAEGLLMDRVKAMWNNLPDDVRDMVDSLHIKKMRTGARSAKTGTWNERTKTMTFYLGGAHIEKTFYHEVGHARWYNKFKSEPDKVLKFIARQKEIGTSPTKYSESYRHYYDKVVARDEKIIRQIKRIRTLTPEEERVTKENRARAEHLYQNECHSELNAYAMGEMPPERIITSSSNMTKLLDAYKELWDL